MFWGLPWDAGYLLPANSSAYRLLTIDTCLPGVAGSVVGYPVHLTVTALASTSVLGRCNSPIMLTNLPSNGAVVINTPGGPGMTG
ncbi:hypothetical protein HaLaN_23048 [Haematococcus lacustris]|uniref:Uncharacterized protein n=1 Tax=Haematococcus lacustris TaxID=44745 RepID=A0A6A0A126_HAELA|nr:hypothetical protein HaLaN_23048 [Haematococcus lacustris]